MAAFLKSLFRARTQPQATPQPQPAKKVLTYEDIKGLPFSEIVPLVVGLEGNVPISTYIDLSKRCYELALLEDGVSDKDRTSAWELAEAGHATIKGAIANDPEAIASLESARQSMIELGRRFGYGSLNWNMDKAGIPTEDRLRYAMRPENRKLLKPYLDSALSGENESAIRGYLIRELIWQSDYKVPSAVLRLHGLAAKRDIALCALVPESDYYKLLRTPENYAEARSILVGLGLLPARHGAQPFRHVEDLTSFIGKILVDKCQEADAELQELPFTDSNADVLSVAIRFLYMQLASAQLLHIYGEGAEDAVFSYFQKPEIASLWQLYKQAHQTALEGQHGNVPLDVALLMVVMNAGGPADPSEEEFRQMYIFVEAGAEWLNAKRVLFLDYLRFILRALSNPAPRPESDIDKQLVQTLASVYRQNGSKSAIAESAMNFEDWIGDQEHVRSVNV